jgi:hypothetical protein
VDLEALEPEELDVLVSLPTTATFRGLALNNLVFPSGCDVGTALRHDADDERERELQGLSPDGEKQGMLLSSAAIIFGIKSIFYFTYPTFRHVLRHAE